MIGHRLGRMGMYMEEHTCEWRLPHIYGNVVRKWEISGGKKTAQKQTPARHENPPTPPSSPIYYCICMEEHTCEARLPHRNGNVVKKTGNRKCRETKRRRTNRLQPDTETIGNIGGKVPRDTRSIYLTPYRT